MNKAIQVEKMCKSYGADFAIENLSLSINQGEVFGLLGANGAGKSTTIECILGTKDADSGSVSILGLSPTKDRKRVFQEVTVQFQESCHQDRILVSELCEVTSALYTNSQSYLDLLEKFDLSHKKRSAVSELSGGEKQRLFVLLALIPNPKVVFFDELTTGLDVKARRELWKYLKALKERGMTMFLTSHFMDEVEMLCDRICILRRGKCVFEGSPTQAIMMSKKSSLEDAYLWFTEEEVLNEGV